MLAKKEGRRMWGIIAVLLGVVVFFFGISLYTHVAGLASMRQAAYLGLTRPWGLTPRIPRIGIVLVILGAVSLLSSLRVRNPR
jgi:H+/Cl- antiporter ClcA